MKILEAFILGIVQGLTEFLPVSSSGHLVFASEILGKSLDNVTFDVFLHFGTFLSIVVLFYKDVIKILFAFIRFAKLVFSPGKLYKAWQTDADLQLAANLVVGTIPAAFIGYMFEKPIEALFGDAKLVSIMLICTGIILLSTRWSRERNQRGSLGRSLLIGIAQAVAIIPGISRSGSTIAMGLHAGLHKKDAVHFSFLLALPVILGASVLKGVHLFTGAEPMLPVPELIIGTLAAFLSGCVAISILLRLVQTGKFHFFAYYCFFMGISAFIFFTVH